MENGPNKVKFPCGKFCYRTDMVRPQSDIDNSLVSKADANPLEPHLETNVFSEKSSRLRHIFEPPNF